ncbi:MAG: NAD(P)-dependent oxidoreductase [Dehalococcoidales bacterium]|jgi:3-hydroxyisobutyrate dehydrogenase-like beta-hydroxyacid dehydrogenase
MKIGFIGIGQMGKHMSRNIQAAGHELVVNDIRQEAAAYLLEKGAAWAATPQAVAEACRIVISCLPTPQSVEQVVGGNGGLKSGWRKGDIYIDMSTNSPSVIRRIAADAGKMGVTVLDAPVSGGTRGAEKGTLTIMVGGDMEALKKVRPVLEAMGKNIYHVGDAGCGNVAKLVNNLIALACNSITAEGFALGAKAGVKPEVLYDIIKVSTANSWTVQQYPDTTFQGNFEPGFKISLAHKDIGLALALGDDYGVPLPVGQAVKQDLEEAMAAGLADKGVDAVILNLEKITGVPVRTQK